MIDVTKGLDKFASQVMERRKLMKAASLAAAGAAAAGIPLASAHAATFTLGDADVLNFALNLEYLEAEYYLRAVTGYGLSHYMSLPNAGTVTAPSTTLVPFQTPQLAYYAERIASDELAHVQFLIAALGSAAVPEPNIDLDGAFTTLATAAKLIVPGQTFNPFANEIGFLVGAYIFEDVGVTAYGGGANFIKDPGALAYAASVLAIEGYHSGAIRGYLASNGGGSVTNAISGLRATLANANDDNGTMIDGAPFNIINVDSSAQTFRRTFNQVLNIVYAGTPAGGLFFPNGMNGTVKNATDVFNPYSSAA